MKFERAIVTICFFTMGFTILATSLGIFSNRGEGKYVYRSIREADVVIYGKGVYRDMSAEVAPQGIAQDYVTLFMATPMLMIALYYARRGSIRSRFILAGTLAYFLVTYLFYTIMGMYNNLFLVYVLLMGLSFYGFLLTIFSFDRSAVRSYFKPSVPVRITGAFLVFNAVSIAILWLSIIVPPLIDGSLYPVQVEHYTTLIVQGMDLGILLPAAFITGINWMKRNTYGMLFAPVYFVFLLLLMTALTAKVIAMAILGYNVIPVIFIIPFFNLASIICTILILNNIIGKKSPG